jgi:hypothetical protein
VADKCRWFVTAARGQGGFLRGGDIRDSVLTLGLKMEMGLVNHSAEAWPDAGARRVAKGGGAGGRRLASKGRRVQRRQGDKRAGKAAGKRLASVVAGGGRRGPSAGVGRPTARKHELIGWGAGGLGAVTGFAKWGNPSGPPFDMVWLALDGAETSAAYALRGTSRSPR